MPLRVDQGAWLISEVLPVGHRGAGLTYFAKVWLQSLASCYQQLAQLDSWRSLEQLHLLIVSETFEVRRCPQACGTLQGQAQLSACLTGPAVGAQSSAQSAAQRM